MANIQDKTLDEIERFLMAFMGATVGYINDLSTFSTNILSKKLLERENLSSLSNEGGKATLKEFQKCLKRGETFHSIRVDDNTLADYLRFLEDKKVLYMSFDDLSNPTHGIVFRHRDLEKMKEIRNMVEIYHHEKGEIDNRTFTKIYDGKRAAISSRLTSEQAELFRYYAKERPFLFTMHDNSDGTITALYDPSAKNLAQEALLKSDWILRGNFGAKTLQQIQYRNKGRGEIVQSLEDGKKEFYIVSKHNPKNFVHITENQVSLYKNEQEISSVLRDDVNFKAKAWNLSESISSPALMEPDSFSKDILVRQQNLANSTSLNIFPDDILIEEEMLKYNRLRDLVRRKQALDNENQGDWALYADCVPFSEYAGRELMSDTEAEKANYEKLCRSMKESAEYQQQKEVVIEDRSLDSIIAKAEKVRDSEEPDRTESKERENEQTY